MLLYYGTEKCNYFNSLPAERNFPLCVRQRFRLKKSTNEAPPLTTPLDITITEEGKNKVVQIKAIIHSEI